MIKLVIYATHSDGYFDLLIENATKLGYDIKILGWQEKWLGFYKRTLDLYNYFLTQNDNDVLLCIDGFDSLILDECKTLFKKYKTFQSPIVWGVEKNDVIKPFIFKSKYKYTLNGGSFIGRVKFLKLIFKEIIDKFGTTNYKQDDQKIINYINNYNSVFQRWVKADVNSEIFANITFDSLVYTVLNYFNIAINQKHYSHVIENDTIIDKHTKIRPSIISGPGNVNISHMVKYITNCDAPERKGYKLFLLKNFKFELGFIIILILSMWLIYKTCKKLI
jgi:hypothetical protein